MKNCISYWYPILFRHEIHVPRTLIFRTDADLSILLDGGLPDGYSDLLSSLTLAAQEVGLPAFLRTGHTSGKHRWDHCCNVARTQNLEYHILNLVEMSALSDLPIDVWAVREMLPVKPLWHLHRYGNMPLVKEVRAFVHRGQVLCAHPYWPQDAIYDGLRCNDDECKGCEAMAKMLSALLTQPQYPWMDDRQEWVPIASQVASAFADDDAFSVDILCSTRGWYVTDMALAKDSFHWPGRDASCGIAK